MKLINSHGVSVLLYGTVATTLQDSELKSFSNAYDSIFSQVFNTSDNTVIKMSQYYSGFWPLNILYDYNRYNFLNKLDKSNSLDKRFELDCIDFKRPQRKYNISGTDSFAKIRYNFWLFFENNINII